MLPKLMRLTRATILTVGAMAVATPASAQIVHSLNLGAGLFLPTGETGRIGGDVLVEDLNSLVFRIGSFKTLQFNGEWVVAFGSHIEAGLGVGFQSRTVPSFYAALQKDGQNINQDLHLRIIPVTAIVRFLPIGRPGQTQPYVGVGVGALRWRYTESGEFVDANSNTFRASYIGTGTSAGLIIVAGVRMPVNGDVFAVSLEGRWQSGATGKLPLPDFLTNKIDLSGTSFNVMFLVRY